MNDKPNRVPSSSLPWTVEHVEEKDVFYSVVRDPSGDFFKVYAWPEDADYFVHAANAYPGLIEFLKSGRYKYLGEAEKVLKALGELK
jgi:hypothetical protein